jgi:hypothetical protein
MCTQFLFENGKRRRQNLEGVNEVKKVKPADNDLKKVSSLADALEEPEVKANDKGTQKEELRKEKNKKRRKSDKIEIIFDNVDDEDYMPDTKEDISKNDESSPKEILKEESKIEKALKAEKRDDKIKDKLDKEKKIIQDGKEKANEPGQSLTGKVKEEIKEDSKLKEENKIKKDSKEGEKGSQEANEAKAEEKEATKNPETLENPEAQEKPEAIENPEAIEKPKVEKIKKPLDNYIVKNIQIDEENEKKIAESERAKREWVNQLVLGKPKEEE